MGEGELMPVPSSSSSLLGKHGMAADWGKNFVPILLVFWVVLGDQKIQVSSAAFGN